MTPLEILIRFISILSTALWLSIFIQALLSWFAPRGGEAVISVLRDITDPLLAPIRRFLPPVGGLDFSPIVAIVAINVISSLLISSLNSAA